MVDKISYEITSTFLKYKIIKKEDEVIYQYGIKLFMLRCLYTAVMLAIGIIMSLFYESIFFIIAYSSLRKYGGGYHASDNKHCFFTSCIVNVFAMLLIKIFNRMNSMNLIYLIMALCCISILLLAPADDKNKPAEALEIEVYKRKSHIALITFLIIMLAFIFADIKYYSPILSAFLIETFMLFLGIKQSPRFKIMNVRKFNSH